jgi:hypothetical protein
LSRLEIAVIEAAAGKETLYSFAGNVSAPSIGFGAASIYAGFSVYPASSSAAR